MKVCVLSFSGLDTDGRDATRILKEMRSLANAGHEVKGIGLRLREDLPRNELYHGVEIRRINHLFGFDRKLQREVPKHSLFGSVKRLFTLTVKNTLASGLALFKAAWKENADVYHCFGIYSIVPGFFVKFLKRTVVIYDSYEPAPTIVSRIRALGAFAKPLSKIVEFFENIMVSRIDYVLTISSAGDFLANRFRKYNRNIIILENVPERDFGGAGVSGEATRTMRSMDGKKLFYMGALTKDKGVVRMIDMLRLVKKEFKDIKLALAGSFGEAKAYDNAEFEVKDLIKKLCLQDNVVFLGFVPRSEIFKCLKSADIAIQLYQPIPWFTESKASSSLFEYMVASLPIVASDFAGFRSIIEESKCGVSVDPTSTEEISQKVVYLLENPGIARKLGENGRRAFEAKYNWQVEEVKLLQVYHELEKKLKK